MEFDPDFAGPADYVQFYRHLQWQVVPAGMPGEVQTYKRPLIPWRQYQSELVDDQTAATWFNGRRNGQMGILTGACSGGIFVIDLDTHKKPEAAQWWQQILTDHDVMTFDTPTQVTGGGGTQILFRAPDGWTPPTTKTSIGVDIRGQGGFAMLPPSRHESGREYAWNPEYEPWSIPVAEAPRWLCEAIDDLIREYGGVTNTGPSERLPGPAGGTGGLTRHVLTDEVTDGREQYMTRIIWAVLVDAYRESPIMSDSLAQILQTEAFSTYVRHVQTRIKDPKTPRHILLEREGRGISLFRIKWQRAYAKWDTEIREAASQGSPAKPQPPQQEPTPDAEPASDDEDWDRPGPAAAGLTPTLYWDYDTAAIQPRRWLYGRELILKFVSVLGSPGGVGKSTLASVIAMSVALGYPLLKRSTSTVYEKVHTPGAVWIYNGEDPTEEMLRRLHGIMLHYNLRKSDFKHPIYMDTGRDKPLIITERNDDGELIAAPVMKELIEALKERKIRLLVVDPFAHTHTAEENRTEEMVRVMSLWAQVADKADCAIWLVHHFRKGGQAGDAESFRGSSAIQGAARVMSTLSAMTEDEANKLDIDPKYRRSYVRLDNAKSNMAPPADVAQWFKLESVGLGNATDEYPEDMVQVVSAWEPPSPFDGLTWEQIDKIMTKIQEGLPTGSRYTKDYKPKNVRWVGHPIIEVLSAYGDNASEQRAKSLAAEWLENGFIMEEKYHDPVQRKERDGIIVDRLKLAQARNENPSANWSATKDEA